MIDRILSCVLGIVLFTLFVVALPFGLVVLLLTECMCFTADLIDKLEK